MTDHVADVAQRKALACEESKDPDGACRWYLTAADAWMERGSLRSAGECLTRAAFNAHVLKHHPQAAIIAEEAVIALRAAGAAPCRTAPALVARGLALASMEQPEQAFDAWEAAMAAHLGGFEATRARGLAQLVLSHAQLLDPSTAAAWQHRRRVLDVALAPLAASPWWEGTPVGEVVPVLLDEQLRVPLPLARQWGPYVEAARESLRCEAGAWIYESLDPDQQREVDALMDGADDATWTERMDAWFAQNHAAPLDVIPRVLSAHLACLELLAG